MKKLELKQVSFKDLKIGEKFKYKNNIFHKTLLIDMGSVIYNAITDEVFGEALIVCLSDDRQVYKIVDTK